MKIVIRTDASLKIGSGHVMRCLTLAHELKSKHTEIIFICREQPGNLIGTIEDNGFKVLTLSVESVNNKLDLKNKDEMVNDWLGASQLFDADETRRVLKNNGEFEWLIVDHYALDAIWEKQLKPHVNKIIVIDDLADRLHDCDAILDQNYYLDFNNRYQPWVSKHCHLFLGPKYTLIRNEFREQRKKLADKKFEIEKIFVFFGGVDLHNSTQKVLEALVLIIADNIKVDVVVGAANPNIEALKKISDKNNHINLHVQINNMAEMMADADLSIGAGGTVTWERCCLGLPTIAWPIADNQKQLLEDCAHAGLVYLPDFDEPTVDDIALHIKALMHNTSLCKSMKENGLEIIDGRGASRIANFLCSSNIVLSVATEKDMEKVFAWRNEPEIRRFSHNNEKIDFKHHKAWFNQVLADKNRHILIGSNSNEEIGVLRFDTTENTAELSIYLRKEMTGKGYGSALIKAGEDWLKRNRPEIGAIIAEVLPENTVSIGLFNACGYEVNEIQFRKSVLDVK